MHPLSAIYPVRPVQVIQAARGVVLLTHHKEFHASAASIMLVGTVQAAESIHITADGELEELQEGKEPGTLFRFYEAFMKWCSKYQDQATAEKERGERFQQVFR